MPIENDTVPGQGTAPADAREALLRRWLANWRAPFNPDAAGVVAEAETLEQESLAFAESVRQYFGELAGRSADADEPGVPGGTGVSGVPGAGPGSVWTPDLNDLLIASQVVVDMCQAMLDGYEVGAARQKTVERIYKTVKPLPDAIRQAMAPDFGADAPAGSVTPGAPPAGGGPAGAPDYGRTVPRRSEPDPD